MVWDATDASGEKVSSGIYFARITTGDETAVDLNGLEFRHPGEEYEDAWREMDCNDCHTGAPM